MVLNMVEHDLYLIHSFKSWFNVMYLENCGFIIRFFHFSNKKLNKSLLFLNIPTLRHHF